MASTEDEDEEWDEEEEEEEAFHDTTAASTSRAKSPPSIGDAAGRPPPLVLVTHASVSSSDSEGPPSPWSDEMSVPTNSENVSVSQVFRIDDGAQPPPVNGHPTGDLYPVNGVLHASAVTNSFHSELDDSATTTSFIFSPTRESDSRGRVRTNLLAVPAPSFPSLQDVDADDVDDDDDDGSSSASSLKSVEATFSVSPALLAPEPSTTTSLTIQRPDTGSESEYSDEDEEYWDEEDEEEYSDEEDAPEPRLLVLGAVAVDDEPLGEARHIEEEEEVVVENERLMTRSTIVVGNKKLEEDVMSRSLQIVDSLRYADFAESPAPVYETAGRIAVKGSARPPLDHAYKVIARALPMERARSTDPPTILVSPAKVQKDKSAMRKAVANMTPEEAKRVEKMREEETQRQVKSGGKVSSMLGKFGESPRTPIQHEPVTYKRSSFLEPKVAETKKSTPAPKSAAQVAEAANDDFERQVAELRVKMRTGNSQLHDQYKQVSKGIGEQTIDARLREQESRRQTALTRSAEVFSQLEPPKKQQPAVIVPTTIVTPPFIDTAPVKSKGAGAPRSSETPKTAGAPSTETSAKRRRKRPARRPFINGVHDIDQLLGWDKENSFEQLERRFSSTTRRSLAPDQEISRSKRTPSRRMRRTASGTKVWIGQIKDIDVLYAKGELRDLERSVTSG